MHVFKIFITAVSVIFLITLHRHSGHWIVITKFPQFKVCVLKRSRKNVLPKGSLLPIMLSARSPLRRISLPTSREKTLGKRLSHYATFKVNGTFYLKS